MDTEDTSPNQKGWNYKREEEIALCRSFINLSKNAINGTEKKQKIFLGVVHKLFGELIVKGTKPRNSIKEIWPQKFTMNRFKWFTSPSVKLWNSCYYLIKEENDSGVPESEFESLADPEKTSPFCLHHTIPIFWELPKFDAMMCQLTNNKLVNNKRTATVSGMEHLIRTKAAKTAARTRDIDIDIDPYGDVLGFKESDRLWMTAMNDIKRGLIT